MPGSRKNRKQNKNNLPVFESDDEFLDVFQKKDGLKKRSENENSVHSSPEFYLKEEELEEELEEEEDFSALLEESFKNTPGKSDRKPPAVPLKKRLKRYPGAELELDLHGYTAVGAQVKINSFVLSCKQQGYFTLRVIVGRGLHSEEGAVLPDIVEDELKKLKSRNLILSYKWEGKKKKQSGAMIVYVKQFEEYE